MKTTRRPISSQPRTSSATPLPRDTRDTLFLLAVLAWTLAPQVPHVPIWASTMAAAAMVWRGVMAWRQTGVPSRWLTLVALLTACGLTLFSHGTFVGREAGLTLLVVLAALKTLELRARRDATVVFFLGFFLVLANFLHSQSLALALGMAIAVWGLLAALMLSHLPVGRPALRQVLGSCARLMAWGAPLVILLFLLFPRVGPLWGQPGDMGGRTGLSNRLRLGDVAELAQDDSLAMRLRTDGPLPAPSERYFRGPVLSDLRPDGQWVSRSPEAQQETGRVMAQPPDGDRQSYELVVEPLRVRTLPLPELTVEQPVLDGSPLQLNTAPDGVWTTDQPLQDRVRVRGERLTRWRWPGTTAMPGAIHGLDADRQLPEGRHPATRAWARTWFETLPRRDSASVVAALLNHVRTQPYRYTMAPGDTPRGADALDHFWLNTRGGFCEHYAASAVTILRTVGIPARIVTGYLGGQVNAVDGVLEIRQSDAHAWIEYWHHSAGWVRADPTAAVAPERIERATRPRPPPGPVAGALWSGEAPAWATHVRELWGAADHRWNEWVLGYSAKRQRDRLRDLGWDQVDTLGLLRLLGGVLGGAMLAGLGVLALRMAWQRRREPRDPWLRTWEQVRVGLSQRGLDVPAHHAPSQVARQIRARWPDQAPAFTLAQALDHFEQARYGRPDTASDTRTGAAGRIHLREASRVIRRLVMALPHP